LAKQQQNQPQKAVSIQQSVISQGKTNPKSKSYKPQSKTTNHAGEDACNR
jgi:hypothetical protein